MGVKIELSWFEMMVAALAGVTRQIENVKKGRKHAHGASDNNSWQMHIEGAMGEYALAKYLGVHWSGKGDLRAPDVGEVDVRTSSRDYGDLILHESDPDDRVFWLVCGQYGEYVVHGWILAGDGKKEKWWGDKAKTGRPAFFVPQSELNRVGG